MRQKTDRPIQNTPIEGNCGRFLPDFTLVAAEGGSWKQPTKKTE